MENTYAYLKTVFQGPKQENKANLPLVLILLVLFCIPLPYAFSNIALGVLALFTLITFKKSNFKLQPAILLPIALFLLMALSLTWTHDLASSSRALSKGLPLLVLPLIFLSLPPLSKVSRQKLFQYYSYGMFAFAVFYLAKAVIRFLLTKNANVFFYHELVTEDVNAIHVSVYAATAVFYLVSKIMRTKWDVAVIFVLTGLIVLLSSKNIIIVFFAMLFGYILWRLKRERLNKTMKIGAILLVASLLIFSGKIIERFRIEYQSNVEENSLNYEIGTPAEQVFNVSVKRAWTEQHFRQNDYFPGTAFRVYQIRIFKEMLCEDPIFFTGYGLNASGFRIAEKRVEHGLYKGYEDKNFHNQYIQFFAELGIFGLLILLLMLLRNLLKALKTKDFVHISFAVLMISLFLTESFLSRQRGIMFFTILYCLFNTEKRNEDAPTLKNKT